MYVVEPAPPEGARATSLCTWKSNHHAPRVAVEVVSESTAEKDYVAEDPQGTLLWPTEAEFERAAKERERAAKEAAEAEVAMLRAELARLRSGTGTP